MKSPKKTSRKKEEKQSKQIFLVQGGKILRMNGLLLHVMKLPFLKLLDSDEVKAIYISFDELKIGVSLGESYKGKNGQAYWRMRSLKKSLGEGWRIIHDKNQIKGSCSSGKEDPD